MKTDPATAFQHTRCIQALTAIGICTDSSVIDVSGLGAPRDGAFFIPQ